MDNNNHNKHEEEEQKIPVFTVLKNNTILKNIFLLRNPISVTNQEYNDETENQRNSKIEEILTVGRHPDCTIMLTHPSISRFHLRIYLDSSLQKMSVIDLASVHGTWVSDRKVEPGVRVELNEGDTIQMGCSSRVYKLHWVSLSIALDFENSIEDNGALLYGKKQVELLDSISETVESYSNEENLEYLTVNEVQSASPMSIEEDDSLLYGNKQVGSLDLMSETVDSYSNEENLEYLAVNEVQSASPMPKEDSKTDAEKLSDHCLLEEDHERSDTTIPSFDPTTAFTLYDDSEDISDEEKISNYGSLEEDQEQQENTVLGLDPSEGYLFDADFEKDDLEFQLDVEFSADQRLDEPEQELYLEVMHDDGKIYYSDSLEEDQEQLENIIPDLEPIEGYLFDADCGKVEHELKLDVELNAAQRLLVDERKHELQLEAIYDDGKLSNYGSLEEDQERLENLICDLEPIEGYMFHADCEQVDNEFQLVVEANVAQHLLEDEPEQGSSLFFDESVQVNNHNAGINVIAGVEPTAAQHLLENESDMQDNLNSLCFDESIQVKNQSPSIDAVADKEYTQLEGESETAPTSPYAENELSDHRSNMGNIWSRRGRPVSVLQIQTGSVKGNTTEVATADVFMRFGDGDENYTPNKENVTPNPHSVLSKLGKGMEKQKRHLTPYKLSSSKLTTSSPLFSSADKENQTPSNERKFSARKSSFGNRVSRMGRVPFQSLLLNSAKSSPTVNRLQSLHNNTNFYCAKSSSAVNRLQTLDNNTNFYCKNTVGGGKKKMWYMVVDRSCLLDKNSMKALQLLQGLKGTQLIIPKTVIRELDDLKLRVSMFRRQTEVFTALKWIEECTVSCKRWIHVQNSFGEGMRTVLTPPDSPQTTKSMLDAVSPKSEDRILEYALLHKRLKNDGQLVLLSNDVNLKIKAMAKGVICETAEEFRDSLVNPFSERFMWAESSPRGQTWSCSDDIVLRDIYYGCPIRKSASKGLKLILLHNSCYGQI